MQRLSETQREDMGRLMKWTMCTYSSWLFLVPWAVFFAAVVNQPTSAQEVNTQWCDFSSAQGNTSSGDCNDGDKSSNITSLPECVPLDDYNLTEKVFDLCEPFMRNRCYLYDYGLDFDLAMKELDLLNAALLGSKDKHIRTDCRDVIRAFVCSYYYVGCNPSTRLPQGICEDSCVEYVHDGDCASSFVWLVGFAESAGTSFVFTPYCDDPLWMVAVKNPAMANVTLDTEQCINMSEVVENPVIDTTDALTKSTPSYSDSNPIVGAAIGISVGIILVIGAILLVLVLTIRTMYRQKKIIRHNFIERVNADRRSPVNKYTATNHMTPPQESLTGDGSDDVRTFKLTPEDINMLNEDLRNALIPFEQVKITGDLGEGAFGCVYKGILTKETESGVEEVGVAIKTIKNHSAYHELKGFLKESTIMCSFSHPNVLGMEGISLDPKSQSPYLILPFMKNGDLKTFLRRKRSISLPVDVSYPDGLDHSTLLGMCYQISCGMEYLASRKLVHRDLAARNCMIDRDHSVKVADFGLTRGLYQKDYYRQNSRGQLPVKWMAPESLVDRISNEKTDVWSFGVTCWEIFSLARTPYPSIANSEIVDYLVNGHRLPKPTLCRDKMYEILLLCWREDPDKRPRFENLADMLGSYSHNEDRYEQPLSINDSYVDMHEWDFSSTQNSESDTSFEQTLFSNSSSSPCSHYRRSTNETVSSSLQFSKHTPSVPSPLLHSTSYDIPNSIPRESFLQQNLSVGSAASVYLDMLPATPVNYKLEPLKECPDD